MLEDAAPTSAAAATSAAPAATAAAAAATAASIPQAVPTEVTLPNMNPSCLSTLGDEGPRPPSENPVWAPILTALQTLTDRQAAVKADVVDLTRRHKERLTEARRAQAEHQNEVGALTAAQAATIVNFERRERALLAAAAAARKLCSRSRGCSLKARAAVALARSDAEAAKASMMAATNALEAKALHVEKLQQYILKLEAKLKAQNARELVQLDLLSEAERALEEVAANTAS
eukprot:CAMPEP_0206443340 /NCGR_PEP_ID=MMETSP0324_2-20121206/14309_1 /ASSEMBLY_ACC=CAM_ASM_000836 /TAXON_ID=2866 /ORGANISM="Crypthecodinium cohnii, Strain Seligo" /LENGTH=231 /DNA_ID=CAMNT_0053911255 /DNA_START=30 /DNA_END=725 /DNA_ORIENTATION=-